MGGAQVELGRGAAGIEGGGMVEGDDRLVYPPERQRSRAAREPGLRQRWIETKGRIRRGDRRLGAAGVRQRERQPRVCGAQTGIEIGGHPIGRNRGLDIAGGELRGTQRHLRRGVARKPLRGGLAGLHRGLHIAALAQGVGEADRGVRAVCVERYRPTVANDGQPAFAAPMAQIGQGHERLRVIRAQGDDLLQEIGGQIGAPCLEVQQAIEIERRGLVGIGVQRLAIESFGLVAAASLVLLERGGEDFGRISHWRRPIRRSGPLMR